MPSKVAPKNVEPIILQRSNLETNRSAPPKLQFSIQEPVRSGLKVKRYIFKVRKKDLPAEVLGLT